ncbi:MULTISPECIES: methyl-accepting chemotaxis protein [unclassified Pseudoalteromonas]|uniref:methyl-accepting chemotaxis protein n=1 Tax=unclassified Pseudoalteromonas TaxID=194690 RepID=UPI002097C787|nr:methyl-accepting chemotaxis protein [Pseudoalteromonas sp. XMcav2-N]MCO7187215.1 methyl-accepting chemotaxis protein [Pseudoalteromonas sp. XMcav2-N]
MLKKLKIGARIYLMGTLQLVLMLVMGLVAASQMVKIGYELSDIAEEDIPLANFVTKITEHQLEQAIIFERALFHGSLSYQGQAGAEQTLQELKQQWSLLNNKINQEFKVIEAFTQQAITKVHSDEVEAKFRQVADSIKLINKHYQHLVKESDHVLSVIGNVSMQELTDKAHKVEALEDNLKDETIALLDDIQAFTQKAALKAERDEQNGLKWILITLGVALVFNLIAPFVVGHSITSPISNLSERLHEISEGDGNLTILLNDTAKDETGDVARAFNQFLSVLRGLISKTNKHAFELGSSSHQALEIMRRTATDLEQQKHQTALVAAAVTQMAATTKEVAQNTSHAADVTQQVIGSVASGKKVAEDSQYIMTQMAEQVSEVSNVIANLVAETNNIGSVLASIQGIAEQTNLLALNAAIEAARAGESGRGFAVVADEVRTLAQRTQSATVDIQDLLTRLQSEANEAVLSMSKGSDSTQLCLEKSALVSKAFADVENSVEEIVQLNVQIATVAEQQSVVTEEINQNLVNISTLADETAQGAKETESASESMKLRVSQLQTGLDSFSV